MLRDEHLNLWYILQKSEPEDTGLLTMAIKHAGLS